jgi:hypothetical protein
MQSCSYSKLYQRRATIAFQVATRAPKYYSARQDYTLQRGGMGILLYSTRFGHVD